MKEYQHEHLKFHIVAWKKSTHVENLQKECRGALERSEYIFGTATFQIAFGFSIEGAISKWSVN